MFKQRMMNVWNNTSNLKRLVVVLISLMLVLCVPASKLTTKLNEFYVNVTVEGQKNEDSSSYEAWITEILVDEKAIDLSVLPLSDGWSYHPGKDAIYSVASEGKSSSILTVGPYQGIKKIQLSLEAHQWCGMLRLETHDHVYVEDLYSDSATQKSYCLMSNEPAINWRDMKVIDYMLLFGGYALVFVLCMFLMLVLPGAESAQFSAAYTIITAVLWLTCDWIQPERSVMLFVGVLSFSACFVTARYINRNEYQEYRSGRILCLVAIVSAYASFASFGYRLFLAGDSVIINRERLAYYLLGTLWFFPVVISILMVLEAIGKKICSTSIPRRRTSRYFVGIISFGVALACFTIPFFCFFPGFFSSDSIDQLLQIQSDQYSNWHPVVHTWILKLILMVFHHPAAIVYVQLVIFAVLIGRIAVGAYDCGANTVAVLIGVAVFSLLPNQALVSLTPMKDIMFTYVIVWATVLLFEIACETSKIKKTTFVIQLVLSMYLLKELRHNGIVCLLAMVFILLFITARQWITVKFRGIISVVAAVSLIVITEGPVFAWASVVPNPVSPYTTMFCGVGACLHHDRELSPQTMERLEDVMNKENWKKYYGRFVGHDNYVWGSGENLFDLSSFGAVESFKIYFEALMSYPDIVIKDRLDGMNIMWDVTQPDDAESFNLRTHDGIYVTESLGFSFPGYSDGEFYYVQNPIADVYRRATYFAFEGEKFENQLSDMLLWRTGAYLIFFLILAIYWTKNRLHRMWWAAMPMLGNIAAMVLVLYHQSFRYIYFIQLCVLTLTLMTFQMQRKQQENTNNAVFENV